jgi:hypothetical protein
MNQDLHLIANPPRKIFIKLTVLGCVLVGMVYVSLLILNTAMNTMH